MDPQRCNWIVKTDGGVREEDCAAAAWILGLWGLHGGSPLFEPWKIQGTFLDPGVSVFAAEAIALDEATQEVDSLIIIRQ